MSPAPQRGLREHAVCQVCHCRFTRRIADARRGWAKCCSKSCAASLRQQGKAAQTAAPQAGATQSLPTADLRTSGPEFNFN